MNVNEAFLDRMREIGDAQADLLVADIFAQRAEKRLYSYFSISHEQLPSHNSLPAVQQFLSECPLLPPWFQANRLVNGQRFFKKYALDIMTLLGALSLPYCYAATPGNKAIYFTEKMRKAPGKRLLETAHFIISVMKEGSFSDGSASFEIQKTRLIHAMVRHHIHSRDGWDLNWGVPVNQEDMAGTNLAFSYIVLRGLEQSNYNLTENEKEDFLYAWRYVGFLLRIDESLLPANSEEAKKLEQVIKHRHFRKSEEGTLLTHELIQHYKESFPALAGYFVDSQIRYLIGPEVAEMLEIKADPFKDRIITTLNRIREKVNKVFVNPYSYRIMIRNHFKLKERYSQPAR